MANYEVRAGLAEVEAFDVVGISTITDNQKGTDDINALWERFFSESIGQQILDKTDDAIYAVYSDYQGDHEAPYRLTIGYRVSNDACAIDMHRVRVQPQEYAVMSAAGEQPKALIETWEAIWSSDIERSYTTDFEVYGPRFFEQGVNEVLVHVGVKS
ncbi:MAG TPA: GyrI-like domain-containing protein [Alphaproteobacteria bacterium]|nr:GyrI-like domain-containing protein [Alphaproteobacteria bacterium]USO05301.1 MAG: GyrI-like domain-containing protein [Rhodospirillales bacterium]HOO81210.1 GyrI-like domain-containing protein [Alphaproteobacteria bacterium]